MPQKYQCWEDDRGIMHQIPRSSYRVAKCGEFTGILINFLSKTDLLRDNYKLCIECWRKTKVYREWLLSKKGEQKCQ